MRLTKLWYCQDSPIIQAYLLFLIGCCVEMHARNMHQYSAAKAKKIEDAAMWFERCEALLMSAADVPDESDVEDVVLTPQAPVSECQESPVYHLDASPLVQKKGMQTIFVNVFKSSD